MPVHLLRDADIKAISIVGKGANRKRFFLFKSGEDEGTVELGHGRLLKAADWSAVYCVVAEPGAHEDAGMVGDQAVEDRWASEDEIRKAAHRFMANGGLVNKMHESLEPYGQLVENAVALADFTVDGETIRKGSWYIAIAPSEDGKAAIEKGEFTGVSVEGFAVRELVEKGSTADARSVGSVEKTLLKRIAEKVGLTSEELAELEKSGPVTFGEIIAEREFDKALPDAFDAFRDSVWRAFFPPPNQEGDPVSAISQSCDEFKAWALGMLDKVPVEKAEREDALGVDLIEEALAKRAFTAEQKRKLAEEGKAIPIKDADGKITGGRYPIETTDDLENAISAFGRGKNAPEVKAFIISRAKALGATKMLPKDWGVKKAEGSTEDSSTKDGDMTLTDSERQEFDALKKKVDELDPDKIAGAFAAQLAKALGGKVEDEEPTAESIAKRIEALSKSDKDESELAKEVESLKADIAKLAEGDSSQTDPTTSTPEPDAEAVRKSFEAEGVSPTLAGVI